jgi:glycosyltransferase involved in cell wall biosynthesis
MRVLFATQYGPTAASSRTRVFQYLPYLLQHQVRTEVITVLPDVRLSGSQVRVTRDPWRKLGYYLWATWRTLACGLRVLQRSRDCDVLFIQKVIFPAPVRWLLSWSRPALTRPGRRWPALVYDFDDAIFTTEVRRQNWLAAWKLRRNAAGLPAMLRLADQVLVENDYTAAYATRYCSRVAIITGPIDTERFCPGPPADRGDEGVVLGWIGSATTVEYLGLIRAPLARLCQRFPQVRVRVVGVPQAQFDGVCVEAKPWSLEEEVADLRGFDIGLMPVPDDPWTRGKGGYKLLQYMAVGLPVVTSPVGVNQEIVQDGESGFWARTPEEWEGCLARLLGDPELRRRMGQRGRAAVVSRYSLDLACGRLLELLEETSRGRRA